MSSHPISTALACIAFSTAAFAQTVQVIPAAYSAAEAASSGTNPWGNKSASVRTQYCYDSTLFTGAGVAAPVLVSRMRWRANASASTTTWSGGSYSRVKVDVSTSPNNFAALSTTFDNNHGTNRTNVCNGSITFAPGSGLGTTTPGNYVIDLQFDTPFLYNPANGDFLVDIAIDGSSWVGGTTTSFDNDASTTGNLGSRLTNTTSNTATTGTFAANQCPVVEFTWSTASTLAPSFTGTALRGASPLQVQFADRTYSPTGVTAWAWDFNNDGVTDSTVQNPTNTFGCGIHTVRLTVTDTSGTQSLVRSNMIVTDEIVPSFTFSSLSATAVQFTDTTTPAATAWAWDLDGDGVTDSTAQNPVWLYPNSRTFPKVTLTASRLCGPAATVAKRANSSLKLDVNVSATAAGLGTLPYGTNYYFNLNVFEPQGISLQGFQFTAAGTANFAGTVNLYARRGGYSGFTSSAAGWTLIGTGSVTIDTSNVQFCTLNTPALLMPGSYGIDLHCIGALSLTAAAPATISNSDLSVTFGAAATSATPFAGTLGTGRAFAGSIYYTKYSFDTVASVGWLGNGCPGSLGVSTSTPSGAPRLGQTWSVTVNNAPLFTVGFIFGFSSTTSAFGALPLDLSPFGITGCNAYTSPDSYFTIGSSTTSVTFSLPIPNSPSFSGVNFFTQGLVLDAGAANPAFTVTSDATCAVIGN